MLVCFTIGEMFALAKKLQVPETPAWSNNPQEAARDIVRHFERSGALAFLVEALRESKPLVEWPEPLPLPVPPAPPPVAAPAPSAASPAPRVAPTVIGPDSSGSARAGVGGGATVLGVPAPQALEFADTALEAPLDASHGDRPTPITDVSEAMLAGVKRSTPPAAPAGPAAAGFAPAVMPRPGEPMASPPAFSEVPAIPAPAKMPDLAPASRGVAPAGSEAPRSAAWPGTRPAQPAEAAKKAPDPRVLMGIGAGVLLVLIGVAFLAGRASSSSGSGSASGSGEAAPSDRVEIAQTAANALGTALLRVAKACQIDPATLRGRSLFEVAYRRCGPLPQQAPTGPRIGGGIDPPDVDPTTPTAPLDPVDPQPTPGKKGKPGGAKPGSDPAPTQPSTGGSSCLSNCQRSHSSCTSRCGAEPQQGSQYDAYQSCLSGCLKALSQCKMGCQ